MGKLILRGAFTFSICVLTHAIILGMSPNFFNVYVEKIGGHSGGYSVKNYLLGIRYALFLITIYGFWLLYLPGFAIYKIVVDRFQTYTYIDHIVIGALVGVAYALPIILLRVTSGGNSVYTALHWITFPTACGIGAVYGFMYRSWWYKDENDE